MHRAMGVVKPCRYMSRHADRGCAAQLVPPVEKATQSGSGRRLPREAGPVALAGE